MKKDDGELFGKEEKHESYGTVSVTRFQWNGLNLFGSSLKHNHGITLTVNTASKRRHLNRDWIHSDEEIVRFSMSETQFGRMLSSVGNGNGDGVPVTLEKANGKKLEECPSDQLKKTFGVEVDAKIKELPDNLTYIINELEDIRKNKKRITAKMQDRIIRELQYVVMNIESNLPFLQNSFVEAMETVVDEAKTEIETHCEMIIRDRGIETLKVNDLLDVKNLQGGNDNVKKIDVK